MSFLNNKSGKNKGRTETKEEKERKKQSYANSLYENLQQGQLLVSGKAFNTWELDASQYVFKVRKDTESKGDEFLHPYINTGSKTKPELYDEVLVFPPGLANVFSFSGIGKKFETSVESPISYSMTMSFDLGYPLPAALIESAKIKGVDVQDQVEKTINFLDARREAFVDAIIANPSVYPQFRSEVYNSVEDLASRGLFGRLPTDNELKGMSASEQEEAIATATKKIEAGKMEELRKNLGDPEKLNLKHKVMLCEVNGVKHRVCQVGISHRTYNAFKKTPERISDEINLLIADKKQPKEVHEVCAHIRAAEEANYGWNEPLWTDENGMPILGGLFESKIKSYDICSMRVRSNAWSTMKTGRGVTFYLSEGRRLIAADKVEKQMINTDAYRIVKPHTKSELTVLSWIKERTKPENTSNAFPLDTLVKELTGENKMTKEKFEAVVAKLEVEHMVVIDNRKNIRLKLLSLDVSLIPEGPDEEEEAKLEKIKKEKEEAEAKLKLEEEAKKKSEEEEEAKKRKKEEEDKANVLNITFQNGGDIEKDHKKQKMNDPVGK